MISMNEISAETYNVSDIRNQNVKKAMVFDTYIFITAYECWNKSTLFIEVKQCNRYQKFEHIETQHFSISVYY